MWTATLVAMPPPPDAELPLTMLLLRVSVPPITIWIPPPLTLAELLMTELLLRVSVPPFEM